jgi:hypothetical protein
MGPANYGSPAPICCAVSPDPAGVTDEGFVGIVLYQPRPLAMLLARAGHPIDTRPRSPDPASARYERERNVTSPLPAA